MKWECDPSRQYRPRRKEEPGRGSETVQVPVWGPGTLARGSGHVVSL